MINDYSEATIAELVSTYSPIVFRTAFTYCKQTSDAEDLTQEVFLSLIQKQPTFESEEHLKAWLLRVCINKAKNHLKRDWFRRKEVEPEDLAYLPVEQMEMVQAMLKLDAHYRVVLHLYYYLGYDIKEIAEILKMRPATVGTRLKRGRENLRKILGEDRER